MIRSWRERLFQATLYEIIAFVVALPLFTVASGSDLATGAGILLMLMIAEMLWSPLHNTVFDLVEWRRCAGVASARPMGRRIMHAVSHEVSSMIVTVPILMFLGGHGFWTAVALDVGLTIVFAAYAFLFHLGFDRLRPVGSTRAKVAQGRRAGPERD